MYANDLNFALPFENKLRQAERKRLSEKQIQSEIDWQAFQLVCDFQTSSLENTLSFHPKPTDLRNLKKMKRKLAIPTIKKLHSWNRHWEKECNKHKQFNYSKIILTSFGDSLFMKAYIYYRVMSVDF